MSEGKKEILLGDCLELMKDIPNGSIDMILADLPYGTTACKWDTIIPFDKLWEQYERVIKPNGAIVLTASQPFTSALVMSNPKMFKYEWIWEKAVGSNFAALKYQPMKEHENILVFGKGTTIYNPIKEERKGSGKKRQKAGYTNSKATAKTGQFIGGIMDATKIKNDSKLKEEDISDKLYKDYHRFKMNIFNNMVKNNPSINKVELLKKSQKLLDRILFIFFAEDRGLLPPNTISIIIDENKAQADIGREEPLYNTYKIYFKHIDKGNDRLNISEYNGGLFAEDELLDNLIIDDSVLKKDALKISSYDFSSDIDVNILGHIFENSLNDIDELHAEVTGAKFDKSKTKRKKDGVFYTPNYITKYIVENTIGVLCEEKKKELGLVDIKLDLNKDYKRLSKEKQKLLDNLHKYREYLTSLKILDPACGSGAFLNQALEFLIEEHKFIDLHRRPLEGDALGFFDVRSSILENNLYGVDINEESVELARLSLWLRTAERGRKLDDLSKNIKCGNSLIDDESIAGKLAFDWNKEFSEIMQNGGFDVVIGNPPYGATIEHKKFYIDKFGFKSNIDTYKMFSILTDMILNNYGFCGLIIPNSWMTRKGGSEFRKKLLIFKFHYVISFVNQVFSDANIDTCIIIFSKNQNADKNYFVNAAKIINPEIILQNIKYNKANFLNWVKYDKFNCELNETIFNIFEKLTINSTNLGKQTTITGGYKPYQVGYGKSIYGDFPQTRKDVDNWVYHSKTKIDGSYFPDIKGGNISSYYIKPNKQWVKWGIWLMSPKKKEDFLNPKIVVREVSGIKLNACFDDYGYFTNDTTHMIRGVNSNMLKYFLTIINSVLMGWFFRTYFGESNDLFPKIKVNELENLPIKNTTSEEQIPFIEKADIMLTLNKSFHEKKSEFIEWIKSEFSVTKLSNKLDGFYTLNFDEMKKELKKQMPKGKEFGPKEIGSLKKYYEEYKTELIVLDNEIKKTDLEIDEMVFKLYGLTDEEKEIINKGI